MQAGERGQISFALASVFVKIVVAVIRFPAARFAAPCPLRPAKFVDLMAACQQRLVLAAVTLVNRIRTELRCQNTIPLIPGRKNRKRGMCL